GSFGPIVGVAGSVAAFLANSCRHADTARHLWSFAGWCRGKHLAVLHTTELYSNVFGLPGAAIARVPVRIASRREINPDKSTAQLALQRAAYAAAHRVVANSQAAAARLRLGRAPDRKIAVVPNGLSA